MESVNVQFAKNHISALLKEAEQGRQIIIERGSQPVARLVPLDAPKERDLGFVPYQVPETFFDPLPDDELDALQGSADER